MKKPMPSDFVAMAQTLRNYELQKHYGAGEKSVTRWIKEAGINPHRFLTPPPSAKLPIPDDFAERAPRHLVVEMARFYGRNVETVRRWYRQMGIKPRSPHGGRPGQGMRTSVPGANMASIRVTSIYEDAASVIQRERFVVFRCNDKGGPNPNGKFWRVGNTVLTPAQLLERAERYRLRQAA